MADGMATMDEPKKKRKQNVACDACKLRRVKCDLTDLLLPSDPSSSTTSTPSLPDLVKANPHVECTNCKNKGIKCTTNQILNPVRPNKGGKRIEEARKRFGGDEGGALDGGQIDRTGATNASDGGTEPMAWDFNVAASTPTIIANPPDFAGQQYPPQLSVLPEFMFDQATSSYLTPLAPPAPQNFSSGWNFDNPPATLTSYDPSLLAFDTNTQVQDISSSSSSLKNSDSSPGDPPSPLEKPEFVITTEGALQHNLHGIDAEAAQVLDSSWEHRRLPHKVSPSPAAESSRRVAATLHSLDAHHLPSPAHTNRPGRETNSTRAGTPLSIDYTTVESIISSSFTHFLPPNAPSPRHASPRPSSSLSPVSSSLIPGRKRIRKDETGALSTRNDSWRLWAEDEGVIVRWGRREAVQENLADRALGIEMGRHLVKIYFNCVHPSFPALSPESFYLEWERADHQSDLLSPAQEALCAVMQAWGARYSDNPVVLGLTKDRAHSAPKVIMPNGTLAPGTQARAHWGRSRLSVCNALLDRARKLIDYNGLLRVPSVSGLQAILMYNQLLHLSDQKGRAAGQFMENQIIHATIIEQMKLLQLMWDSTGEIPADHGEMPVTIAQVRLKQRRIFFTVFVTDSFNAAASGDEPKIADDEIDAVGVWLQAVEAKLPLSTFKALVFFMTCYLRLAIIGRKISRRLTHPNRKPGTIHVYDFVLAVRECWSEIISIARDIVVNSTELLKHCQSSLLGFSPLNYISNLRMSCPFLLLVIHQVIREQLDFRKNLKESFITEDQSSSSTSPPGPEEGNVALLEELHMQSVDVLLHNCRAQVAMYKTILPTGMVQTAAIFLRVLIATAQFLAEVPTVEQGYPNTTLGGYGWTWETKQREITICVDALYQLGWAWADIAEVLDSVMVAMERMQPSAEVLAEYAKSNPKVDMNIVQVREQEAEEERLVLAGAMRFWPPKPVSTVIEAAMRDIRLEDDEISTPRLIHKTAVRQISGEKQGSSSPSGSRNPQERMSAKLAEYGQPELDLATATNIPFTRSRLAGNQPQGAEQIYGEPLRVVRPSDGLGSEFATPSVTPHHQDQPSTQRTPAVHRNLAVPDWMVGFNYAQSKEGQWNISGIQSRQANGGSTSAQPPVTVEGVMTGQTEPSRATKRQHLDSAPAPPFINGSASAAPAQQQDMRTWTSTDLSWMNFDTPNLAGSEHNGSTMFNHANAAPAGMGMIGSEVGDLEKLLMSFQNEYSDTYGTGGGH